MNFKKFQNFTRRVQFERLLLPLLLVVLGIFWWPTRNLPYWWDSAGLIMQNADQFLQHNLRFGPGLLDTYAHPPFLSYLMAVVWKVFGEKLLVSHIVNLFFAVLLMVYTYLLAQQITLNKTQGKIVGVLTGILLLFTPVFLAQIGIIYLEIPGTAFALMTLYYFLRKNYAMYLVSATLMLYTKEVFVFIILTVALYIWIVQTVDAIYKAKKFPLKSLIGKTLFLFIPIALVSVWFIYHKAATGWLFTPPGSNLAAPRFIAAEQIVAVFKFFFIDQWRVAITIMLLVLLEEIIVKDKFHKYILRPELLLLSLVYVAAVSFFSITDFLQRYIIIGLPFFYLIFFYLLTTYIQKLSLRTQTITVGIILLTVTLLFQSQWNLHRRITTFYFPPLEDNLEYLDIIAVGQSVSQYLEKNFPKAKIVTAFPATYMFAQPYQGYVKKPLISKSCDRLKTKQEPDIIVFHAFSPISPTCLYEIELYKFKPYRNFERNGKFMSIYIKK